MQVDEFVARAQNHKADFCADVICIAHKSCAHEVLEWLPLERLLNVVRPYEDIYIKFGQDNGYHCKWVVVTAWVVPYE